ncbi:hypothetical protein AU252_07365 [Pseudarthrobacter sulfonivorans]|uniref:Uncharacterized protein n=1 Tax=Pseudarthrobacter sulfonivorans TaxID=121292 RepID=A0A0U2XAL0_9MICC|nr:hypothetical protein AU252_07365 [Pseudarthrobacter sulfonivorans]
MVVAVVEDEGEGDAVSAEDPLLVVAVGSTVGAGVGVRREVGLNGHDLETVGVGDGDALVVGAGEVSVGAGEVPVGVGDVVVGVALEVPVGVRVARGVEGVGEGDAVEVAVSVAVPVADSVAVSVAVGSGDADSGEVASDDGLSVGASSGGSDADPSTGGGSDSSSSPPRTVWLLSSATGMAQRCAPTSTGLA